MRSYRELLRLLEEAASRGTRRVAILPVGCTEQHGPVLPLETDSILARGLARDLADRLPAAHAFPVLEYTTTEPNTAFCGTVSVPAEPFRGYLRQVCVGILSHPFDALVLLNAHGSIEPSLREVAFGLVMDQYRSGTRPVRPVLVVGAFDFDALLERELGQKPGRHADWREFLLVYRELGDAWFTPERRAALERFATEHDFERGGLPPVLGVPMELRSADGVQGEPWPASRDGLAEQAGRLWRFLLGLLEERVTRSLDDFDRDYAWRSAGVPGAGQDDAPPGPGGRRGDGEFG